MEPADGHEGATLIGLGAVPPIEKEPPVQVPPPSKVHVTFTVPLKLPRGSTLRLTFMAPPGGAQSEAALGGCKPKSVMFRVNPADAAAGPLKTSTVNGYVPTPIPEGTARVMLKFV